MELHDDLQEIEILPTSSEIKSIQRHNSSANSLGTKRKLINQEKERNKKINSHQTESNLIPKPSQKKRWITFIQFSLLQIPGLKTKYNPYSAELDNILDFLCFLRWSLGFREDIVLSYFHALALYLPDLRSQELSDTLLTHEGSFSKENQTNHNDGDKVIQYYNAFERKSIKAEINLNDGWVFPDPYPSTWCNFDSFCVKQKLDPFLASHENINQFFVAMFGSKEIMKVSDGSLFIPEHNFYRDNMDRICRELNWYLKSSSQSGFTLSTSQSLLSFCRTSFYLDEGSIVDPLALNLTPDYVYSKFRLSHPEKGFWSTNLTTNMLTDVSSGVLSPCVVAKVLGITEQMVYANIVARHPVKETETFTLRQYQELGFGSSESYWREDSIVKLLCKVKVTKSMPNELSTTLGVSRREVETRCGEITDEVLKEHNDIKITQNSNKSKQQTQLEIQIVLAEENIEMLSDYEKMRLANIKEMQSLVEFLDFDSDKNALKMEVGKRGEKSSHIPSKRSSRIKLQEEAKDILQDKEQIMIYGMKDLRRKRLSPPWVGECVPKNWTRKQGGTNGEKKYFYDNEKIAIPVPKMDLPLSQLLEIVPKYQCSLALMDSFSAEMTELSTPVPGKLNTRTDWTRFELVKDTIVSAGQVTSLDLNDDVVCYGTEQGGVGIFFHGRSFTVRPHNRTVTNTLLTKSKGSTAVISSSLDGTVRMVDIVSQVAALEYSWDWNSRTKHGVGSIEQCGTNDFLLLCGNTIVRWDLRSRDHKTIVDEDEAFNNKISLNPKNNNIFSTSEREAVWIWDLRKTISPVEIVVTPSIKEKRIKASVVGASWSPSGELFSVWEKLAVGVEGPGYGFVDSLEFGGSLVMYESSCLKKPQWEWPTPVVGSFGDIAWCPWGEDVFLTTYPSASGGDAIMAMSGISSDPPLGEMYTGLNISNNLVKCNPCREEVVVGNINRQGGLTIFKQEKLQPIKK